jgi:outer membrane immunogenic protein
MRRIITTLTTIAAAVGLAFSANAADLPVRMPGVMLPAANNWGGWYVGANAGYSWGNTSINYLQDPGLVFGVPPFDAGGAFLTSVSPNSFIGGGQLGFNYQAGIWVLGLETDFAWRDRTESVAFTLNPVADVLALTDRQKWVGTVRGRIGISPAAMNNWLFYATAGLAYGGFDHSVTQVCNLGCGQARVFSDAVTRAGWAVGGGIEVAINRNWSLGAEYLYMDFGTDTLSAPPAGTLLGAATFTNTTVSFHDKSQVARMKLNYRFGDAGLR